MDLGIIGSVLQIVLLGGTGFFVARCVSMRSRPRRTSRYEIAKLRAESHRVNKSNPSQSIFDTAHINSQESVEHLRLYTRFADRYSTASLDSIISSLRYAQVQGITNLQSPDFTDEQMSIYQQFNDITLSAGGFDDMIDTTMFAVSHMEDAPRIMMIIRDRGICDLKQIKPLLREMKDHCAPVLSEGVL